MARPRSDLSLSHCFDNYEFSVAEGTVFVEEYMYSLGYSTPGGTSCKLLRHRVQPDIQSHRRRVYIRLSAFRHDVEGKRKVRFLRKVIVQSNRVKIEYRFAYQRPDMSLDTHLIFE